MIFSLLIFLGIWANIDNLLMLLPAKYAHIQWVIFWIALGSFIDMSTGINNTIIGTSPTYKIQSLFMVIFVVIIIVSNAIFIPMYGIEGAAFASAISMLIFNVMRWMFLWKKYKMQPFNYKFLIVLLIGILIYILVRFIPRINPFYIDLTIRSIIIFVSYISLVWILNLSHDITERLNTYSKIVFHRK